MTLYSLIASLEVGLIFSLMALGVYLTFRVLDFPDLTVDGSFPMGAAISSVMIITGANPWIALAFAFTGGCLSGLVTAWLNVKMGILHLLASIITMTALYSINIRIMGRPNISLLGEQTIFTPLEGLLSDYLEPHYVPVFVVALILLGTMALLNYFLSTETGLALRATGNNPRMARAMGISTEGMTLLGVSLSNGLVAFSGALFSQSQGSADIGMGIGTIVAGLVSVIIGEAIFSKTGLFWATLSVITGSVLYRLAIGFALSVETGDAWYSLKASDLNLITALIVIAFLAAPKLRKLRF